MAALFEIKVQKILTQAICLKNISKYFFPFLTSAFSEKRGCSYLLQPHTDIIYMCKEELFRSVGHGG